MLNRLPDIVVLARQRARALWTCPTDVFPQRRPPRPEARLTAEARDGHKVSLLYGDDLSVMSGLLSGQARDGPLAGRVSMVWLSDTACPATGGTSPPQGSLQHRARRLIDLCTRLFLARDLLGDKGVIVVTTGIDADRCAEHLLSAVFAEVRTLPSGAYGAPTTRAYVAGAAVPPCLSNATGTALLGEMACTLTARHDHVLVMGALPAFSVWVAALERRWVLAQSEPETFSVLREHIVNRQRELALRSLQDETTREWAASLLSPERQTP